MANKVIFDVLANSSQYKKEMQGIEKTTNDTSKSIKAAFVASTAAIGGTLAAFGKYETALIKVGKTADIQGKELDSFGKRITDLSSKIPLSTNELLELSASAAQLGVKGKDNILKFTETVAKLGTATNITGEEGSQAIARLLNVTGEGIQTVDKFASIIVRLGNNVAATESEILSMASRVGKSTAQFDLGTTAVLGISAALKEVGIEAELGGSAIGRTFAEMQNAVFNGGEALDTFSKITGKSGAELKQIFQKDATQAFTLFIEALNKLPAEQVATSMESMGLKGVRLREVIGTLAKRSEILGRSLALASDEAERQTALNEEFQRAVGSLENSFKFMQNEVINLAASMGKDLAPAAKEIFQNIGDLIKEIRQFNEATGGAVTTSIVMAAKVSALVIAVNKLKSILLATGIISATMAGQLGMATAATSAQSIASAGATIKNKAFALSFATIGTASKSALLALKNFQVGLGAIVGGLVIAIDLGTKLGNVIGKLGELNTSEQDLVKTQKELNSLMETRSKLQEKVNSGDSGAQQRLNDLDKEIAKKQSLIDIIKRETAARDQSKTAATPSLPEVSVPSDNGANGGAGASSFSAAEDAKTASLQDNVQLRIAAAQREADLLAEINRGMTDEAIKNAEQKNSILADIDKKKSELDRVNLDLARTNINENEKAILESKRSAIEQELAIMDEKFAATQEKTKEQIAADQETQLAGKQILNRLLTQQENLFREEKIAKEDDDRETDIERKTTWAEEDLLFLQNNLMTEEQARDQVKQDRLKKEVARRNQQLKDEVTYGKTIAKLKSAQSTAEYQTTKDTFSKLSQLRGMENSKAASVVKGFAIYEIGVKTAEAAMNAYNSMVGIPFVGPALGAAAAGVAIAYGAQQMSQVKSQQASFAVGTDFVPSDMLANIHQGEAIIPAKQNQFLQSGDLVLGSPDAINNTTTTNTENQNTINLSFQGANFIGNLADNDEIIGQIFDGLSIAIDEGRLPGFEGANLSVT